MNSEDFFKFIENDYEYKEELEDINLHITCSPLSSSIPIKSFIMSDYIENKLSEIDTYGSSMPIYGSSPTLHSNRGITSVISSSLKSWSNFINFKL
jgi:hypothetical protein